MAERNSRYWCKLQWTVILKALPSQFAPLVLLRSLSVGSCIYSPAMSESVALVLMVKDLLLLLLLILIHPSVASYAEMSEHYPCLPNQ